MKTRNLDFLFSKDEARLIVMLNGRPAFEVATAKLRELAARLSPATPARKDEPSRETYVHMHRLLKKGLLAGEAAAVMQIDEAEFRRALNQANITYGRESDMNAVIMRQFEAEDYVLRRPRRQTDVEAHMGIRPDPEPVFMEIGPVARLRAEGKSIGEMADALGVLKDSLASWLEANGKYMRFFEGK